MDVNLKKISKGTSYPYEFKGNYQQYPSSDTTNAKQQAQLNICSNINNINKYCNINNSTSISQKDCNKTMKENLENKSELRADKLPEETNAAHEAQLEQQINSNKPEFSKTENYLQEKDSKIKYDNDYIKTKQTNNMEKFKKMLLTEHIKKSTSQRRIYSAVPGDVQHKSQLRAINTEKIPNEKQNKNYYLTKQTQIGKEYERIIKTAHETKRLLGADHPNPRLVSQKMLASDIFFINDKNEDKNKIFQQNKKKSPTTNTNNFSSNERPEYLDSDIFNIKNNLMSINKIGEKQLLKVNRYQYSGFYPSAKSNSEWSPKNQSNNYMNYHSSDYDIFNPLIKKNINTIANLKNNSNGFNPANRQKSISEFIDLTRNGVPNTNKELIKALDKDNKIFSYKEDLCSNFLDLHREYKYLVEQPFVKKAL